MNKEHAEGLPNQELRIKAQSSFLVSKTIQEVLFHPAARKKLFFIQILLRVCLVVKSWSLLSQDRMGLRL